MRPSLLTSTTLTWAGRLAGLGFFRDWWCERLGNGHWRRTRLVLARPARDNQTVETLAGPVTAADGEWIVKGDRGEQWPVPAARFAQRHERPMN